MKNKNLILSFFIMVLFFTISCNEGTKNNTDNKGNNENTETITNNTENSNAETNVDPDKDLFVDNAGNFKIKFPGEPQKNTQAVETEIGNVNMITFMYEKDAGEAYMLAYSDYPEDIVAANDHNKLLQNAKGGFIGSLGITIEEEKEIKLGDHSGIYFKGKSADYFVVMKDYLVKNRLYQIGVLATGSYPSDEAVENFVNSFKLIED